MTKRMLIDASHGEETRVVVLDGNRLEDFDVETATKKQLKGNIYLAKVVRVEPSLQAAFIEYGGNRHGFLAFAEIHPDYYQIPVADRQRLLEMQEAEAREAEAADDAAAAQDEAAEHELGHGAGVEAAPLQLGQAVRFGEAEPDIGPGEPGDEPINSSATAAADAAEDLVFERHDDLAIDHSDDLTVDQPDDLTVDHPDDLAVGHPDDLEVDHPDDLTVDDHDDLTVDGHDDTMVDVHAEPSVEQAHELPLKTFGEPVAGGPPIEADPVVASGSGEPEDLPDLDDGPAGPGDGSMPGTHREVLPDIAPDTLPAQRHGEENKPPGSPDRDYVGGSDPESGEPESLAEPGAFDAGEDDHQAGQAEIAEAERLGDAAEGSETGGEAEDKQRRQHARHLRSYKIQEVIRRRQILLVQVVKEERGTKGAALTTYISLAGRFSVLMPNSPRGGGISRKITASADRRRLKEVTAELQLPRGMGIIVRTAGAQRPKPEIRRDCEYLLRLWDDIRDTTMASMAPALIHEEASLIKRSIRDVYSSSIDEIQVDGEDGWRAARDFMRMLMPTHASKVQLWRDPAGQPLFAKHQVEAQLDAMLSPNVQLRSGGYLVINQTEALVAIDVNSGRSTRERSIEETAVRTNLEAADEVARQLRLRDLAGLIVIDFIDMESRRNNVAVERRIAEALRPDRARIQIGHISSFGLLEMSRQRLRPSLAETSFVACSHCAGTGLVRSTESAVLHVLRGVEEEAGRRRAASITVHVAAVHAVYLLNHKRAEMGAIEHRYGVAVCFGVDETLPTGTLFRVERIGTYVAPALPYVPGAAPADEDFGEPLAIEADDAELAEPEAATAGEARLDGAAEAEAATKRRRRRRGRKRDDQGAGQTALSPEGGERELVDEPGEIAPGEWPEIGEMPNGLGAQPEAAAPVATETVAMSTDGQEPAAEGEDAPKARRRGRRGGRRKPREDEAPDEVAVSAVYTGPTPADPFAGQGFDVFEAIEQAEQREAMLARTPEPRLTDLAPVEPASADLAPAAEDDEPAPTPPTDIEASYADPVAAEAAGGEAPAPLVAANDSVADTNSAEESSPVVRPELQPMVVGEVPQTEKKRGWWRR